MTLPISPDLLSSVLAGYNQQLANTPGLLGQEQQAQLMYAPQAAALQNQLYGQYQPPTPPTI